MKIQIQEDCDLFVSNQTFNDYEFFGQGEVHNIKSITDNPRNPQEFYNIDFADGTKAKCVEKTKIRIMEIENG